MSDFNITARDQLANPGKIFEEITKFTPGNLKTSRSGRSVSPINLTTFNISEILMRVPAFDSPANALSLQQGLVGGVMSSFWDTESMGGFGSLLPPDLAEMLEIANPDGERISEDGVENEDGEGGSPLGNYSREGVTPSTNAVTGLGNVKAITKYAAGLTRDLGHSGGFSGYRSNSKFHKSGYAIDVMVGYGNASQKQLGDLIADFFLHNKEVLQIEYIIWYDRIISSKQNWTWRFYDAKRVLGVRNNTTRHLDHPHLNFRTGATVPRNPKLEWPDGHPVDTPGNTGSNTVM